MEEYSAPVEAALPVHVAVIMDGNGRWAAGRGLPRSEGHRQGAKVFRQICEYGADLGIKYLTFYAFSTENWSRPQEEIASIMALFRDYLHEAEDRRDENEARGFRLRFIGDRSALPADIVSLVETSERESAHRTRTTVNLAVNYGSRLEIVASVRQIAQRVACGELQPADITPADIEQGLYTAGQPDPDLIIRPSGENRLSNFLLWQAAYSEFWFADVLWPDFTPAHFDRALADYAQRKRRFGGIEAAQKNT